MSAPVWYHFLYEPNQIDRRRIIAGLSDAGIDPQTYRSEVAGTTEGCGIVFFAVCDRAIHEFLRYAHSGGRHRIVAVSNSPSLDSHNIWELVQSGAEDVIDNSTIGFEETLLKITKRIQHWHLVNQLVESPRVSSSLVGRSQVWRAALRELIDAALDPDLSVLI